MSETAKITVNRIPSPTWNWLRMNETEVKDLPIGSGGQVSCDVPSGLTVKEIGSTSLSEVKTGMGPEADAFLERFRSGVHFLETGKEAGRLDTARLDFSFQAGEAAGDAFDIILAPGTDLTVVMNFQSRPDADGFGMVQTRYHIGEGAHLTLIQVQRLGDGFRFFNDIGGECDEKGSFELKQLLLSGKETYYGSYTALSGKKADLRVDIGYLLKEDDLFDMNYVAFHTGKKTTCDINASGVLRDRAKKLFRGTIDFRKGCAGSKGQEMEQVLLMDEHVENKTIPVILCDEEDVEGNHGASIGRIDEGLMFYLMTRGMSLDSIYEMMARARIDAVAAKIPDEKTREEVRDFLDEEAGKEPA